ncbi:uncharacterized protein LOC121375087 isoform X2 [Gigantopelta aegis]|uniref:uncharacterized protein LOC121375087 isoform X2 n=1 Tax=Gigantopelta aegis TaxID=1735272 RepID=UPI001B889285|nr:uncharacterized protein LOC121375087 isoform X2 [Gigantopelta aegis]
MLDKTQSTHLFEKHTAIKAVPESPTTTVAVINSTAILVQWVPSRRDGCAREINGYVVVYGKLTDMGLLTDSMHTISIHNPDRRFLILNVDPGVTYGVSVGAFSRNLAGPISAPKLINTVR